MFPDQLTTSYKPNILYNNLYLQDNPPNLEEVFLSQILTSSQGCWPGFLFIDQV